MARVLAIVVLRFRLATRKMRGIGGRLNIAGWVLWTVFGTLLAVVSAIVVGIVAHVTAGNGPEPARIGFMVVLWAAALFGGALPVVRGAIDQGFDANPFLQYPISRLQLYWITLGATGLSSDLVITYPVLASMTLMGVLLPGLSALPGLLLVALFVLALAVWSNLFSLVAVSLMRGRRAREALIIVGLGSLIVLGMLPMVVDDDSEFQFEFAERLPISGAAPVLLTVARLLPPSIAAEGLGSLAGGAESQSWIRILQLAGWCAVGILFGYWVFVRFHLAEPRVRLAQEKPESRRTAALEWLSFDSKLFERLPVGVKAVASKDLRYVFRSVVGRFSLAVGPGVVVLVAVMIGKELETSFFGIEPGELLFLGIMFYAGMITSNFTGNLFAWDSDGVKAYFLSPLPPRHLLLGKNIAIWIYDSLVIVVVLVLWCLLIDVPRPVTLLTGLLIFVAMRLAQAATGVGFSVRYPLARDISSAKNAPAPLVIWIQLAVVLLTTSLIGILLAVPRLLGWEWLQPVVLSALIVALAALYSVCLNRAARMLEERRDQLIEALKSVR